MNTPTNGTEIIAKVTTRGRNTGKPRTVQIRVYYWNGRLIATSPYPSIKRDWVPNIMANPEVVIQSGNTVIKAKGKMLNSDPEMKKNIAMCRISWRTDHCPVLQPSTDSFVEFFPEEPPEKLFVEPNVSHSLSKDPLAAATLDGVLEWQKNGNFYQTQQTSGSK